METDTATPANNPEKPELRWYQLTPNQLLFVVLAMVVATACTCLAIKMKEAQQQSEVVKWIGKVGGTIAYDYEFDASEDLLLRDATPPQPEWLRELLGGDFFSSVWYVGFVTSSTEVNDDSLVPVAQLVGLRILLFNESSVTDAGLIHLQHLTELKDLCFRGEAITDEGLQYLLGMRKLKNLQLGDTQVGDAGMVTVSRLPSLRFLILSGTQVGDTGLAHLQNARNLVWLNLSETPVTDAGMEHLRRLEGLRYLNLAGTQITDKGFLLLKGLVDLKMIQLTDILPGRGKQLRVNMRALSTNVTETGVQELQKALPNCKIMGQKGEIDKAIAGCDEAIRLNPKDATAYYSRGLRYKQKGEQAKADEDFAKAKELGYKPE